MIRIQILSLILLVAFTFHLCEGQEFRNEDCVYNKEVKSIQFTIPGLQTAFPIINLGDRLTLDFDILNGNARYLQYRVQHCNADWTHSDLDQMEYLEGFNDEELRNHSFSINTKIPYTHYSLSMPNADINWTKSGNYLLHVYDTDSKEPLFTRRFMVVENSMKVSTNIRKPSDVSKIQTHVEIDFVVNHKGIVIRNPTTEVKATVLQNGRWDNAIEDIPPFIFRNEELIFDYQDQLTFPAGKEFRSLDIRSLRNTNRDILDIEEFGDAWELKLTLDKTRTYLEYVTTEDLNGQYIIQSYEDRDFNLESEYVYLLFSLESKSELEDQDVYIIGKFCDWHLLPENKMEYDERYGVYFGELLLKQGVYDYQYVALPRNVRDQPQDLEGNWHEAGNSYTVLVYYRPFGGRYDRIAAVESVGY